MNNKKLGALLLAVASTSSFAGTMGGVMAPERFLLIEGGVSYSHSYYQDNAVFAESATDVTPNGFRIDLNNFYPNDFFGGYIGASIYLPQDWLMNMRYDMYGKKSKFNALAETRISIAPTRLSFTLDKVFGDFRAFSYGIGGGVVVENTNDGDALIAVNEFNPVSESIQGRTRIDPLVEGFAMYRFVNNFGVKFNLGYQIPVNSKFGDGDLNLNLGLNYAFPI